MEKKVLGVEELEQIEKILGINLPDNATFEIREMSAEERDLAESGKQIDAKEKIRGLVAKVDMLRVGDNEFRLANAFQADNVA